MREGYQAALGEANKFNENLMKLRFFYHFDASVFDLHLLSSLIRLVDASDMSESTFSMASSPFPGNHVMPYGRTQPRSASQVGAALSMG